MKKFVPLGFVANLIVILIAYKFLGLVVVLLGSIGIYQLINSKLEGKSKYAENLMFASAYIVAVFAVHKIFGKPEYTFMAALLEIVIFVIFSNI